MSIIFKYKDSCTSHNGNFANLSNEHPIELKLKRLRGFWEAYMKTHNQEYYIECLLPKWIDSRYQRSMDF